MRRAAARRPADPDGVHFRLELGLEPPVQRSGATACLEVLELDHAALAPVPLFGSSVTPRSDHRTLSKDKGSRGGRVLSYALPLRWRGL